MREARKVEMLDDVSDHLAEVLRRADALLAEWSKFGAAVQLQVDREARAIGDTVAASVEQAVTTATLTAVDRALTEQISTRLRTLAAELDRLEQRTRTAANGVKREAAVNRKILWAVVAGIVGANVLLVLLFLPPPEPLRIETPAVIPDAGVDAAPAIDAAPVAPDASPIHDGSGSRPTRVPARAPRKKK